MEPRWVEYNMYLTKWRLDIIKKVDIVKERYSTALVKGAYRLRPIKCKRYNMEIPLEEYNLNFLRVIEKLGLCQNLG
jgi:hypothetical protein